MIHTYTHTHAHTHTHNYLVVDHTYTYLRGTELFSRGNNDGVFGSVHSVEAFLVATSTISVVNIVPMVTSRSRFWGNESGMHREFTQIVIFPVLFLRRIHEGAHTPMHMWTHRDTRNSNPHNRAPNLQKEGKTKRNIYLNGETRDAATRFHRWYIFIHTYTHTKRRPFTHTKAHT